MSKVYHADTETHARVKKHCEDLGVQTKVWIDKILRWALDRGINDPLIEELVKDTVPAKKLLEAHNTIAYLRDQLAEERSKKRPVYAEVKKKPVPEPVPSIYRSDKPKPWEQKPFWELSSDDDGDSSKDVDGRQTEVVDAEEGTQRPAEEASQPRPPTVP